MYQIVLFKQGGSGKNPWKVWWGWVGAGWPKNGKFPPSKMFFPFRFLGKNGTFWVKWNIFYKN